MPHSSGEFASPFNRLASALASDWRSIARPSQLPPLGDWSIWLLMAGRGFGKTRTGAEWVREEVEQGAARRIALVAPTAAAARDVMVEGESGILAISDPHAMPKYEPSKRRLTWPNGAVATTFSADEPDTLRGPQHDLAWVDELAAFQRPSAWDMLMLGLRVGRHPRCVVTTTPRPIRIIRDLLKRSDVVVTRGSTHENASNLAPAFLGQILRQYEGTRLGRQEIEAELLEDTPGALWTRAQLDELRCDRAPGLQRIVVAIDPAGSSSEGADETGIIVAGTDKDRTGYVLEDLSGRYTPTEWGKVAISAYRRWQADRVIAEKNFGGEMIENTLRMIDPSVSYKEVVASRGKLVRAEPVSALYEKHRVRHVGVFPQLEDQMCVFTVDYDGSPDRLDALVWALTELMVDGKVPLVITDAILARAAEPSRGGRLSLGSTSGGRFSDALLAQARRRGMRHPVSAKARDFAGSIDLYALAQKQHGGGEQS